MKKYSKEQLKQLFVTGACPSEDDFAALIDSLVHQDEMTEAVKSMHMLHLGTFASRDSCLAKAAEFRIVSDETLCLLTAYETVGNAQNGIFITQQVQKNGDGSGVTMQYVMTGRQRYSRYVNFSTNSVTGVQSMQPDVPRNLYYTDKGFIGLRDAWGTQVGSGFFLPNRNDLREGIATATTVPLVLNKAIQDQATATLGPATTARAGVMTAQQVEELGKAKATAAKFKSLGNYSTIGDLDNAAAAIVDGSVQMTIDDLPVLMYGTVAYKYTVIYLQTVEDYHEPCVCQVRMYEGGGLGLMQRRIWLDEADFDHDFLVATSAEEFTLFIPNGINVEQDSDEMRLQLEGLYGGVGNECILNVATSKLAGLMSPEHVQQLAETTPLQQHNKDVSTLQAGIDDAVARIPQGVLNLGVLANADTILSRASQYAIISDPFIAIITAQYLVGEAVQSLIIQQQVSKNSDGSGVCMQYVFKDKARWTRYVNFNSAGSVTATQSLQSDVPRNLSLSADGGLSLRGIWGGGVGSGITLPNKNDLREGTATASTVPLVLTKTVKDTATCVLQPATTARAGVMTAAFVQKIADLEARIAELEGTATQQTQQTE